MEKIMYLLLLLTLSFSGFQLSAQVEFNCATETFTTKCGENNGKIVLWVEGGVPPYTYKITDNHTGLVILLTTTSNGSVSKENLGSGTYRVDINDSGTSFYSLYQAQIDGSTAPVLSLSATKATFGKSDGTATATVTGGKQQGMFFKWNTGVFGPILNNIPAGIYTCTVTDGDYCTDIKSVEVKSDNQGVTYSSVINRKDCDSLKTLKLDTVSSGKSLITGLDSMSIFRYTFAKTYILNLNSVSCNPADTGTVNSVIKYYNLNCDSVMTIKRVNYSPDKVFGSMDSLTCDSNLIGLVVTSPPIFKSQYGCDSMVVITFKSGYIASTITKKVCVATPDYFLYIPRANKCDSIVRVVNVVRQKIDTTFLNSKTCDPTKAGKLVLNLKTAEGGCDSIVVNTTELFQKLDTTRISLYVCGLKKPVHKEIFLQNRYGCDSLVIIDSLQAFPITKQLPLTRTCDKTQSGNFVDTLSTIYGCDSIIKWSVQFVAPFRKANVSYVCDKMQAGVFPHFFTNQYGCDSTVVDSVIYAGSMPTVLSTKTFCGVKNSDVMWDTILTNYRGCDSIIRQRIIELESPMITDNGYSHPTERWNGQASFKVEGGTMPYKWQWYNTNSTQASASGLKGGIYTATVTDANLCKDTAEVRLSDFWASSTRTGELMVHGGLADDLLIDIYGAEEGDLRVYDIKGNLLFQQMMPMREEFLLKIPVQISGTVIAILETPGGFLRSNTTVK
ncbi:MAG: hypothetical protein M3P22_02950 [bacterium]|nr:hypothetical protein [bacterium]